MEEGGSDEETHRSTNYCTVPVHQLVLLILHEISTSSLIFQQRLAYCMSAAFKGKSEEA